MPRRNASDDSPMTGYSKAPSPFGSTSGSFAGHTPKEFKKERSSYQVIDTVQYYDGLDSGNSKGGGEDPESPMNQQITPRKPKGS